ncbi:MAG: hypothetical protein JNM09_29715 [Blastocatellia bacterium]|nr:hypothetical protein [Blastocatellia bacterium]
MNANQQAKWGKVRARGETWFIVRTALLYEVLFVGLMSLGQHYCSSRGFQGRLTVSPVASQLLVGMSFGLTGWHKPESEYAKATEAAPPATLWQKIHRFGPLFYIVPYGVLTGLITATIGLLYEHLFDKKYATLDTFFTIFPIYLLLGLLIGTIIWLGEEWPEKKRGQTSTETNL